MWIKQYTYPFTEFIQNNKIILSFPNIKFVQIGIECPHSIPIFSYDEFKNNKLMNGEIFNPNDAPIDIKVKISDDFNHNVTSKHAYKINSPDVLEFNNLNKKDLTIEIPYLNNPYIIITAAYEKEN